MSPKIIHLDPQTFLGMAKTYPSVEKFDPEEVFFKLFIPHLVLFKKFAVDENLYAFPIGNLDGSFTYITACKVNSMDAVPVRMPEESVIHSIAAGNYVKFATTPHELGEISGRKMAVWFASHSELQAIFGRDIEVYPPECTTANSLCWNLVPVVEAKA